MLLSSAHAVIVSGASVALFLVVDAVVVAAVDAAAADVGVVVDDDGYDDRGNSALPEGGMVGNSASNAVRG